MRFRNLLPLLLASLLALLMVGCGNGNTRPAISPAQQAADAAFRQVMQQAVALQQAPVGERKAIIRQIEGFLASLGNADLAQRTAALPAGHPLYAFAGRELLKRRLPLPRPLDNPRNNIAAGFPAADSDGYRPPARIGVLLPLTGPLAAAGTSVRDGFLAGYYGESRRRPQLRFHDTAGGVRKAAADAAQGGAQLLVGPLSREDVNTLAQDGNGLPMLLLNRPALVPDNSASFAMSPEDEGVAAAERLLRRGLNRVVTFGQRDDSSQRALASFREWMQLRGGVVLAEVAVPENQADPSATIGAARSHGDAQAIFMALKAPQARVLAVHLKAGAFAPLPRIATALILSGGNARLDSELDGIEYPELPWLLDLGGGLPDADALGTQLASARGSSQRLFAFGFDAWKLAGHLDQLANDPGIAVRGVTGNLRLDSLGVMQREPAWAVFAGGRARLAPQGAPAADGTRGN